MSKSRRSALALLALGLAGPVLGQPPCPTLPPGAMPAPNGFYVRQWEERQVAKAKADRFVIYLHEWCPGTPQLAAYGQGHLEEIARMVPMVPFPVVIEPDPDPALNVARQQTIVALLSAKGLPDAAARVIVTRPMAEGLFGEEAPRIYFQTIFGGFGGRGGFGRGMGGFGGMMGGFGGGMGGFGGGMGGFRGF